jgi:hypothetical protein
MNTVRIKKKQMICQFHEPPPCRLFIFIVSVIAVTISTIGGQFRGSCIFEDANIVISNLSAHRPHQKHKDPAGFATCGVFFWS